MSKPFITIDGINYWDEGKMYELIDLRVAQATDKANKLKENKTMETLQNIYDSEINACIWWNWDGGVEVRLGNGLYGDDKNWEASDCVKTLAEAEKWLKEKAIELYPNSTFAKNLIN